MIGREQRRLVIALALLGVLVTISKSQSWNIGKPIQLPTNETLSGTSSPIAPLAPAETTNPRPSGNSQQVEELERLRAEGTPGTTPVPTPAPTPVPTTPTSVPTPVPPVPIPAPTPVTVPVTTSPAVEELERLRAEQKVATTIPAPTTTDAGPMATTDAPAPQPRAPSSSAAMVTSAAARTSTDPESTPAAKVSPAAASTTTAFTTVPAETSTAPPGVSHVRRAPTNNVSVSPTTECSPTLYFGHCHIGYLQRAVCGLSKSRVKLLQKGRTGIGHSMCATPPSYAFRNDYFDQSSLEVDLSRSSVFRPGIGGFGTVIFSIYSWPMSLKNIDPRTVHKRIYDALDYVLSLHKRTINATRSTNTSSSRSKETQETLRLIILLPHYHRKPSWDSMAPCQSEERVSLYSRAAEAAGFDFSQKIQATAATRTLKVVVQILDLYNWTKALGSKKDADGNDESYQADGHHLNPHIWTSIARELFARGILCDPQAKRPSVLSPDDLLRIPRAESKAYTKDLHLTSAISADGEEQLAEISTNQTNRKTASELSWPSRPSCEAHLEPQGSFWGSARYWVYPPNWPSVLMTLRGLLMRGRFPRSSSLRHQVIQVINREKDAPLASFSRSRLAVTECLNNVGLTENATTWSSGIDPKPSVDYILWKRTPTPLPGSKKTSGNTTTNNATLSKRERLAFWASLERPPIPSCVCVNTTHLLPRVQDAILQHEAGRFNGQWNSSSNLDSHLDQVRSDIRAECSRSLAGYEG